MAKRNYITKSKGHWGFQNWKQHCPDFTFKVSQPGKLPDFIPPVLRQKFNSGYYASSGTTTIYQEENTDFYIGFFVGLRIDKNKLDEQPYVSVYKQRTGELVFDGYLQHGNYDNRTTELSTEQIRLINSSGITVDIHTNRLPDITEGHLTMLAERKIITGLEVTAIKAMEELRKNKR